MSASRNVTMAVASLAGSLAVLAVRMTMFTGEWACPSAVGAPTIAPSVGWAYSGLAVGTAALAVAAMVMERRTNRTEGRAAELEIVAVRMAVFGPAISALAFTFWASLPTACL